MKVAQCILAAVAACCLLSSSLPSHAGGPVSTAFTYQGALKNAGNAFSGIADFEFALYDGSGGGATQIGSTLTVLGSTVTDGTLTASLDFGVLAFDGNERWLEIRVNAPGNAGAGPYTTLAPRQHLSAAPYALYALNAGGVNIVNFPTGGAWSLTSGLSVDSGTLHVDPTNNRVGIGTAAPASTLHVVGNTTLTGNVAISGVVNLASVPTLPPTTRTLNVNPVEFESVVGVLPPGRTHVSLSGTSTQNNPMQYFAPLSLPDGAVVTNITFLVSNTDFVKTMTCSLVRDDMTIGNSTNELTTTIGSGTSAPGVLTIQGVSISGLPLTIDNANHSYLLVVNFLMPALSSALRLHRVQVTYTITAPLP